MFIRVIFGNGRTSLYDCKRVHKLNLDKNNVAFEMEDNDGGYIRLDIDKATNTEVYLMNDEGKTIDAYRWPVPAT